jgi:hypothetical protein
MDKISSIVPRSRRVAAADMSAAPAVRPGMPSFGRPVGISTTGLKSEMTTAQKAMVEQQKISDKRQASSIEPQIVADMADRFFMQKTVAAPVSDALPGLSGPGFEVTDPNIIASENMAVEAEYVPPGTYLDVSA